VSQTISIDVPEAVLERFSRIAGAANRSVEDLLVNALTQYAPRPPAGLPEDLHRELEQMENLPDAELWQVFRQTLAAEDLPSAYVPGGVEDRLMLGKAYAGLLLQWRGHQLPVPGAIPGSE
jgi:predicted transcriptional regulator